MTRGLKLAMNPDALARLRTVEQSLKVIGGTVNDEFKREIVGQVFIHPLARDMAADARNFGRHGPRLAPTIKGMSGAALNIGSAKEPTWAGAVFGGQRSTAVENRKGNQTMTWPNSDGRPKTRRVIKRRQTMQFLPHLGRQGWLIFPTWRRVDRKLTRDLIDAMDRFLEEKL